MMRYRLAMPLLGVLLWVLFIHAGTFATATFNHRGSQDGPILSALTSDPTALRISEKDLNHSVAFASGLVKSWKRLETNLGWSNIHIALGTPSHGQLINSAPEDEALDQGKDALVAAKATEYLLNLHCNMFSWDRRACSQKISTYSFASTPLRTSCPRVRKTCTEEAFNSKYRSIDGTCNHKSDALAGGSFTGYKRLLFPHYLDGVNEPRRSSNKKFPLPSPRLISSTLCKNVNESDNDLTLAAMQWGQFLEHDLAHTATNKMVHSGRTIECCEPDGTHLSPRYIHPFCLPISIPPNDEVYAKHEIECMPYVRSVMAMRSDCSLGPVQQINQASHYLDGSQIYGSDKKKMSMLREHKKGLLKVSTKNDRIFLPISDRPSEHCQYNKPGSICFLSGDSRVNSHPQLTAMYTLWHREHNRIATRLSELNPHWNDEILYQEARRIVVAEIQHITYAEWLPIVLGHKNTGKILSASMFSERTDPGVSNSFATAAFKFINSLIDGQLRLYTASRRINSIINLENHFNYPNTLQQLDNFDDLIRGLATQRSQRVDLFYSADVTSHLYGNGKFGYDVLSLDIQRGRDHGLPGYTSYRILCGMPAVLQFQDLVDVMEPERIEDLKKVYSSPHDIDLLIGGMSEKPFEDSRLGPTFTCLIKDQMLRTRIGDRYFYNNPGQPKPFTKSQQKEVEKVTLARIFCDNGDDIRTMQPKVFRTITDEKYVNVDRIHVPYLPEMLFDSRNDVVQCDNENVIPRMDLEQWIENV